VSYLVDTNVLSEWRKPEPNAGVVEWFRAARADELYLSVVTVGEIRRGIAKLQQRGEHRKASAIESWLASTKARFAERLVPITAEVAEEWGACGVHPPVPTADGLIAATARVHGWTVVTRNVKDFEPTGARLLNPFTN
jgi:toxin FitB